MILARVMEPVVCTIKDQNFHGKKIFVVQPLDEKLLHEIFSSFEAIITIEDGTIKGGFGSAIVEFSAENNYSKPIKVLGIPDNFIEHGTVEELQKICKIDVKSLENLFLNY